MHEVVPPILQQLGKVVYLHCSAFSQFSGGRLLMFEISELRQFMVSAYIASNKMSSVAFFLSMVGMNSLYAQHCVGSSLHLE